MFAEKSWKDSNLRKPYQVWNITLRLEPMFPALRPHMGVISQLGSWLRVPPWVGPARNSELRKQLKPNQKTFLFQILQIELIGFLDIRGVCVWAATRFSWMCTTPPGFGPFPSGGQKRQ